MDVNDLSKQLIGYCIKIHKQLGVGLFESIYEEALAYELNKNEISFQRQIEIPVIYDTKLLGIGFKADFIIEEKIILELKSVEMTCSPKTLPNEMVKISENNKGDKDEEKI
jgi:GxxExxY protein